jgi:hypothetical protein
LQRWLHLKCHRSKPKPLQRLLQLGGGLDGSSDLLLSAIAQFGYWVLHVIHGLKQTLITVYNVSSISAKWRHLKKLWN